MILVLMVTLVLADDTCTLLNDEAEKPSPSLVKCYRHNISACCISAHDQHISNVYSSLFSDQCQRQYIDMEDYMCYACNPNQPEAIQGNTLRICESFAKRLWGGDLQKPSNDYDNCGMFAYWDDGSTILPSTYFPNAQAFFNTVKPPHFENYNIEIVKGDDDCFNGGKTLMLLLSLILIFI